MIELRGGDRNSEKSPRKRELPRPIYFRKLIRPHRIDQFGICVRKNNKNELEWKSMQLTEEKDYRYIFSRGMLISPMREICAEVGDLKVLVCGI